MPCHTTLSRRRFLRLGLAAGCCCLGPGLSLGLASGSGSMGKERLLADFDPVSQGFASYLRQSSQVQPDQAAELGRQARLAYAGLVPELPDLGPENPNQSFLVQSAWLVALYRAGLTQGLGARVVGRFLYEANVSELTATDPAVLKARREAFFSQAHRDELARWAKWSLLRTHPGDWVGEAVFGTGEDFDLGYTYHECGAFKFFKAQGAADVAPYFCLNDFPRSAFEGTGLARAGNLAMGQDACDFRYKLGRPVTQDWDSELARLPHAFAV